MIWAEGKPPRQQPADGQNTRSSAAHREGVLELKQQGRGCSLTTLSYLSPLVEVVGSHPLCRIAVAKRNGLEDVSGALVEPPNLPRRDTHKRGVCKGTTSASGYGLIPASCSGIEDGQGRLGGLWWPSSVPGLYRQGLSRPQLVEKEANGLSTGTR